MIRIPNVQCTVHAAGRFFRTTSQRALALGLVCVLQAAHAGVTIDQLPLISVASVPGNLVLTPSVENPTINRAAYLGDYSSATSYVGYFDSEKCYAYHYAEAEADRYFYPVKLASSHLCTNQSSSTTKEKSLLWSGNYLNWAATQAIDAFRKGLTGGYRVKDTKEETWLEKARSDGRLAEVNIFPLKTVTSTSLGSGGLTGSVPFSKVLKDDVASDIAKVQSRVHSLGNQIEFYLNGETDMSSLSVDKTTKLSTKNNEATPYNPAEHGNQKLKLGKYYSLSVRVKVCVSELLEAECVKYGSYYKPEGLMQKNAEKLRYSIFGYLNDHADLRDGAALRARQKYIGPKKYDPKNNPKSPWIDNPQKEWDPDTGVLINNPDADDAKSSTDYVGKEIKYSGVINYLNRFGQMTSRPHKFVDPVSEMYYAARRFLKNQGDVASYSDLTYIGFRADKPTTATVDERYQMADGFPVIRSWSDPYQFWCQPSVILGIGDTYTFNDKNLPGNKVATKEPSVPSEVSADDTINVFDSTKKVMALEFGTKVADAKATPEFNGLKNSAYIAGMAYDNHTVDLRKDLRGKQTASTYWVDVRERNSDNPIAMEPSNRNQYWLATKYGGFSVPAEFSPYDDAVTSIPDEWWWKSGDTLPTTDTSVTYKRPDTFFAADNAQVMVDSLGKAFKQITESLPRTGAALAANATTLTTGAMVYQTKYDLGKMTGDVEGYTLQNDGDFAGALKLTWRAASIVDGMDWSSRNIYFNGGAGFKRFTYDNLTATQKDLFGSQGKVDYVRGSRDKEGSLYRKRESVLGTLVNSTPLVVLPPKASLYKGKTFSGADKYDVFASKQSARKAMLYVGGNDGMLHGFDASSGEEKFAFIPNAALALLPAYSNVGYAHKYMVDGTLVVKDVYTSDGWKTVLVGSMGFGGRSVFALDVTDPSDIKFLWEKTAASVPALGNNLGAPVITQVASGDWRVLLGNGPNGYGDKAQLVMIGVSDGAVTTVDTGVDGNNGLSGIGALDSNGDGIAEAAYAGDLKGNVWRFVKLSDTTPAVAKLFQAKDANGTGQPITAAPLVAVRKSTSETWVWFGTGRMLNSNDLSDASVQTWYGLIDDGTEIDGRSSLSAITGIEEHEYSEKYTVRTFPAASGLTKTQRGWYADLPKSGERMIYRNDILGGALIGTSRVPDASDPCAPSGKGYIMFINAYTGGRLSGNFLDLDGDGKSTNGDKVQRDGAYVPASGIGLAEGVYQPMLTNKLAYTNTSGEKGGEGMFDPTPVFRRVSWREIRRP